MKYDLWIIHLCIFLRHISGSFRLTTPRWRHRRPGKPERCVRTTRNIVSWRPIRSGVQLTGRSLRRRTSLQPANWSTLSFTPANLRKRKIATRHYLNLTIRTMKHNVTENMWHHVQIQFWLHYGTCLNDTATYVFRFRKLYKGYVFDDAVKSRCLTKAQRSTMRKYPCSLCHSTYLKLLQKGFFKDEDEMFQHVNEVGRHLKPSTELMADRGVNIWDMSF